MRLGTPLVTLALVGPALALTAAPAHAVPFSGNWSAGFSSSSGAGCEAQPGAALPTGTSAVAADGVSRTFDFSSSVTQVRLGDATDTTSFTGSLHAEFTAASDAAGTPVSWHLAGSGTLSGTATKGAATACPSTFGAGVGIGTNGSVAGPAVLELDMSSHGGVGSALGLGFALGSSASDATSFSVSEVNLQGTAHRSVVVPAGGYSLTLSISEALTTPVQDGVADPHPFDFDITATLHPLGSAATAESGTGAGYLTLPDGLSCAGGSLTAAFTPKAGKPIKHTRHHKKVKPKVSAATFYVDGAPAQTVRKPNQSTVVTLGGLPTTGETTVSAVLSLPKKGSVTVSRSYRPCS